MLRHLFVNGSKRATIPDPQQSVVRWNFLLQDISSTGQQEVVLSLFRDMLSAGVHPNASTFPSALCSCARLLTARLGQTIHAFACKLGCGFDPFVASTTLHMYAVCGRMDEAHQVFVEMPRRNVISWSIIIQGYAQIGQLEDAFALFRLMLREGGVIPNAVTMISLVPACRHLGDGECVHAFVVKLGLESHSLVGTSLVDMYLKCRDVEGAIYFFNRLEDKNTVSWLVMVSGLAKSGHLADAVLIMSRMREFDVKPDSFTLVDMLSACAHSGHMELGMLVHCFTVKTGLECDEYVGSGLINMYSSCGLLSVAHTIFDHMTTRNLVVWNSIMHWYAQEGNLQVAVMLFHELKYSGLTPDFISIRSLLSSASLVAANFFGKCIHGYAVKVGLDLEVDTINSFLDFYATVGELQDMESLFCTVKDEGDSVSWNCMIRGYLDNGYPNHVLRIFSNMLSASIAPDSVTLSSVLKVFACNGAMMSGLCVHAFATKLALTCDNFVGTALVDMYTKCGEIGSAYQMFEEMPDRDVVTWNAMVAGYSQHGLMDEALALFNSMNADESYTLLPDFITLASVVSAVAHSGSLEHGRQLHAYVVKREFLRNTTVANATITMYSKCGIVEDAWSIFERMLHKDCTSWTAMIAGYGINGLGRDAVFLFDRMKQESDITPSDITFLEILSACSHAGLLKEGLSYFKSMKSIYKILPSSRHYACIVDLLGRHGCVYEAYLLIRSMAATASIKPDAAVWGALLSACRIHGQVKLGEVAADEIMRLEPKNSGYRVLLSNLYAATGRWNNVADVRCVVELGGLIRTPGWSCIEVRN
ncbi:pentatricopeptide repeat-containing protein At3g12770-like isoform X1 [Nymphaea colorata]|uniref:pentatricopeptide repeat-containing protein At3g12770-like isoform X1 n=1 Tax=Nymphaea colorata TaxID=210225 RepID=UPI00129E7EAE|nr:pentatricopeptide repeat-containing protein At3g12770-like isoform X1 [Nymphaea colorata]XP_031490560.1 pentatricopeptide repeat-containing protein At3g12770-like isoform X1 [Nymphaea colorata]